MKLEEITSLKQLEENWKDVNLEKRFSFREEDIVFSEGESANIYEIDGIYYGRTIKKEGNIDSDFSDFYAMKTDIIPRDLTKNGVLVPKSYGVYLVQNESTGEYVPMIIMEKAKGVTLDKLAGEDLERAEFLQNKQENFITDLGYNPVDAFWEKNGLYSKKDGSLCTLDFDNWARWKD